MRIHMAVTQHGVVTEVSTNLWAVVQWERKYKTKISQAADGMGLEDLAYLAYESLKTSGHTVPAAFDDFVRQVEDIDVLDSATERPTREAPTAAA